MAGLPHIATQGLVVMVYCSHCSVCLKMGNTGNTGNTQQVHFGFGMNFQGFVILKDPKLDVHE